MPTPVHLDLAYGQCHALAAACVALAPGGGVLGLFIGEDCAHSVFRVPHTQVYVDAFGAEGDLSVKAARYLRAGDSFEWRRIVDVMPMVPGNKVRAVRKVIPVARELLRNVG